MKNDKLKVYLTYAGALPFGLCVVCFALHIDSVPLFGDVTHILSVYALVIVSFMAGSHWGQHLHLQSQWKRHLPIFSNAVALAMWLAFLVMSFKTLLIAFIIAFLALLLIDQKLFKHDIITEEYFRTRCVVTAIVVANLIISRILI